MGNVTLKSISYGQLKKNKWQTDNDIYGIAAFVDDNVRYAFLDCPNNQNEDKTAILLAVEDGIVVGRHLLYGTRIMDRGKDEIIAQSSGSTEVHVSQRGKGIGTKINKWTLDNEEAPVYLCSLLSSSCLSLMKKKENDCTIFDFPRFVKIVNTEPVFIRKIKSHTLQKMGKSMGNGLIRLLDIPNKIRLLKLKKTYKILQLEQVPDWAGEMCLNDGHKYAEYHDSKWLQWCLTHNLSGRPEDIQRFFAVYKMEKPVGFFFTKERMCKDNGNDKEFLYGTVCEWATIDDGLSEADLNLLATETFSRKCFHILTVTDNPATIKHLRHFGFLPHSSMQMGFKDKLHQYPDMSDQSLWRIRYGCCNSILY